MVYKVSVYDFVKKEEEPLREFEKFENAEEYAYSEALNYCEDEKPRRQNVRDTIWVYFTNSDFGVLIKED